MNIWNRQWNEQHSTDYIMVHVCFVQSHSWKKEAVKSELEKKCRRNKITTGQQIFRLVASSGLCVCGSHNVHKFKKWSTRNILIMRLRRSFNTNRIIIANHKMK